MNSNARGGLGRFANANKAYDEERLEWGSVPKKYLRLPRLRRATVCLFLIDVLIVVFLVNAFEPLITLLVRNEELFGARLTLPVTETPPPKQHSHDLHAIPRILHQTSKNEKINEEWVDSQKTCLDVYKDYEFKHWTDALARDFIASEYPWFLDTWDNYPFPIQRADAIRYFVLYHYGGIYLDMDTLCNRTIPLEQIESDGGTHHAVFKSTTPTGVSNDLMITSARHPVFAAAISKLLLYNDITKPWSPILPHAAIMISSGPFFLTMAIKNYLLEQPSLPQLSVQVVNATELAPYITDLEGQSWHHGDTKTLMWVGDRPWVWFALGGIGLAIGLHFVNHLLMLAYKGLGKLPSVTHVMKVAKLT